jgi:hypothetical protein
MGVESPEDRVGCDILEEWPVNSMSRIIDSQKVVRVTTMSLMIYGELPCFFKSRRHIWHICQ